jgi:hypothetical protein
MLLHWKLCTVCCGLTEAALGEKIGLCEGGRIQEVKGELEDFSSRGAPMWAENGPPR